ncbi:HAD family hydrolase [Saprospiraceae bacterium]|jgi:HAD superfamily hydrolase (TIGR01509 family)|nr:HAD family hydrolase [Saprospiraceae bacterium]MDC3253712.1 HAD family hydrolase [bacterium]MDG1436137.1 HAD family hydrolase [Saprospiraceae bacterium]
MKPKFIIFDCDGVLVDTEKISCGVIAEEARNLGVDLSNQEALETFSGTSYSFVFDFIEQRLGKKLPENFEENYRKRTFEEFEKKLQPIPGIHDVIKKLNLPFCVASNAPSYKVEFNLKLVNLFPFFENKIFSAYQVNAWKPNPTLFLTAAKKMGFSPSETLVIEDSPVGVQAAVAANMKVLGFAKGEKAEILRSNGANVISKMTQIFNYL